MATTKSGSFQAPRGYRNSATRPLVSGEVVSSTYSVRDEIARTEHAIVYEARDLMLDRPVALKLAWRDLGTPSLIHEARHCATVRDPCAVAIYGMGNHNQMEYVAGERVVGQLLSQLCAQPERLPADQYLAKLRTIVAAVAHTHEAGIAVAGLAGSTVLVDETGRIVLGALSLSQIPSLRADGQCIAPEVLRGEVAADEPEAAEGIDLYSIGCLALEMATGVAPFTGDGAAAELQGHAHDAPPRLADLRTDLPSEVSDLVEWLVAKHPDARPPSVAEVLAELDAVIERSGMRSRSVRVLVVDDDTSRARWLWSLARRAHPAAVVEIASEGTDAAHKLNRDQPDLVLVDSSLRGVMNALELCMYARGLESSLASRARLVLVGEVGERDRPLFAEVAVPSILDDDTLARSVLELVRRVATEQPRRFKKVTTVSG